MSRSRVREVVVAWALFKALPALLGIVLAVLLYWLGVRPPY